MSDGAETNTETTDRPEKAKDEAQSQALKAQHQNLNVLPKPPRDSALEASPDSDSRPEFSAASEGENAESQNADHEFVLDWPVAAPTVPNLSILGQECVGSAGVVFSGWQSGGGRVRVVVSWWAADEAQRLEMKRVATALQELYDPCFSRLLRFRFERQRAFYVIPEPAGLSLAKVLARHGIPRFAWSAKVILEVAKALKKLHDRGILIKDIQPAAIHVDKVTGLPTFAGYGLFQPRGQTLHDGMRQGISQNFAALSTIAPEYVNPERFGEIGLESDIYSLGATLYTLLSGSTPFTGGTAATILRKVAHEDPTPLSRLNKGFPEILESLCMACLSRNPSDRPKTLQVIIDALESATEAGAPGPVAATSVIQVIKDYRVVSIRERRGATVSYEVISKAHTRPLSLELAPLRNNDVETSLRRQRELIQRVESHPNVLRIHEVGLHEGRRFTVTDSIEARTLEDLLAEGPLPVRRSAEVARDVASALTFCHNYGVVHRGARPDLILVEDETGRALLTSIGRGSDVAEEGGGPTTLVSKGLLFSTLFYFAPEQVNDRIGTIDGQTDIFVLGVTLYEMLTGLRPFVGTTPRALLSKIMLGEPRNPRALNHQVDAEIAAICLKALSIDKHQRYLTANELLQDLERWLKGQEVRASSPGFLTSWSRRAIRGFQIYSRRAWSLTVKWFAPDRNNDLI